MERKCVVIISPERKRLRSLMEYWLHEAGGILSLDEVKSRLSWNLDSSYAPYFLHTLSDTQVFQLLLTFRAYRLKEGMVSLLVTPCPDDLKCEGNLVFNKEKDTWECPKCQLQVKTGEEYLKTGYDLAQKHLEEYLVIWAEGIEKEMRAK